mgnify:CR=1 FL=1|jgi:hypothetical protein
MIAEATKLKEAILQCVREVNDACYELRQEGVSVLLPEFIEMEVNMVIGSDGINAVGRTTTQSENDGGVTTSNRISVSDQVVSSTKTGDNYTDDKLSTVGSSKTSTSHPNVTTTGSGVDEGSEDVTYKYKGD